MALFIPNAKFLYIRESAFAKQTKITIQSKISLDNFAESLGILSHGKDATSGSITKRDNTIDSRRGKLLISSESPAGKAALAIYRAFARVTRSAVPREKPYVTHFPAVKARLTAAITAIPVLILPLYVCVFDCDVAVGEPAKAVSSPRVAFESFLRVYWRSISWELARVFFFFFRDWSFDFRFNPGIDFNCFFVFCVYFKTAVDWYCTFRY